MAAKKKPVKKSTEKPADKKAPLKKGGLKKVVKGVGKAAAAAAKNPTVRKTVGDIVKGAIARGALPQRALEADEEPGYDNVKVTGYGTDEEPYVLHFTFNGAPHSMVLENQAYDDALQEAAHYCDVAVSVIDTSEAG